MLFAAASEHDICENTKELDQEEKRGEQRRVEEARSQTTSVASTYC